MISETASTDRQRSPLNEPGPNVPRAPIVMIVSGRNDVPLARLDSGPAGLRRHACVNAPGDRACGDQTLTGVHRYHAARRRWPAYSAEQKALSLAAPVILYGPPIRRDERIEALDAGADLCRCRSTRRSPSATDRYAGQAPDRPSGGVFLMDPTTGLYVVGHRDGSER